MIPDINYLAVFASAVASMAIGFLWYGPVFGKQWIAMMGFTKEQMDAAKSKGMTKSYVIALIGSLVTAYVLAHFVVYTGAVNITGGLQTGFWVWLGFVATVALGSVLWEGKSWKLYGLNMSYQLVNLLVIGVILAVWQ
ncbi:MAG: DUF1761 domain-containing protein [Patescibacteria group bacterium]